MTLRLLPGVNPVDTAATLAQELNGARRPRRAPLNSVSTTLPRSDVVQAAGGEVFGPGPDGWALISSANTRNSG